MKTNKLLLISLLIFFSFNVFSQSILNRSEWDIKNLDTARDVSFLDEEEKDVVLVMNMVRTNPKKFATMYLEPMKELFDGKLLKYPDEIPIMTNEGIGALNECIRVLNKQNPIPVMFPKKGLSKAAEEHAKDIGSRGKMSHSGSDGSSMDQRVNRYGKWDITLGENIDGGNNDALRIVIALLIDDGVKSRGHRDNIFNEGFAFIGVAIEAHKQYEYCCVMDYAGKYTDK